MQCVAIAPYLGGTDFAVVPIATGRNAPEAITKFLSEAAVNNLSILRDPKQQLARQMGVLNTDFAKQLGIETLGARLWRIEPGQASTKHRHIETTELYLLLEGVGRLRVEDELLTLSPMEPGRPIDVAGLPVLPVAFEHGRTRVRGAVASVAASRRAVSTRRLRARSPISASSPAIASPRIRR